MKHNSRWAVQRVFGDEWRTIALFSCRWAAEAVVRCWSRRGGHQAYRAAPIDDAPADLLLGAPALSPEMAAEIAATAEDFRRAAAELEAYAKA